MLLGSETTPSPPLLLSSSTSSSLSATAAAAGASLVAVLYGAWVYWLRPSLEQKKPFADLPMPPKSHWLLGHLHVFRGDLETAMRRLGVDSVDDQGRVGLWVGPHRRGVVLTRAADVRTLLLQEICRNTLPLFRKHAAVFLGPNAIGLLSGRLWKHERAAVLRALSTTFLQNAVPAMQQVAQQIVRSIIQRIQETEQQQQQQQPLAVSPENKGPPTTTTAQLPGSVVLEMGSVMKMVTMDVFGLTAFSHAFGCCESLAIPPVVAAFEHLAKELQRRCQNPLSLTNYFYSIPTRQNQECLAQRDFLRNFIHTVITERRSEMEEQQGETNETHATNGDDDSDRFAALKRKDLVARLLEAHAAAKAQDGTLADMCTDDVLSDVLVTLLFAGYDTTSVTLSWALYVFATNQEIRDNCRQEIDRLDAAATKKLNSSEAVASGIQQLTYCRAFFMEVLRLYPPAFMITRQTQKDVKLGDGFCIPKHTQMALPIWVVHRSPHNFARPEELRPDRWVCRDPQNPERWIERETVKDSTAKINGDDTDLPAANRDNFFSFSAGARACPGQSFSWQENLLVFSTLVRELEFSAVPGRKPVPGRDGIVQHPLGGVHLRISARRPQK